MKGLAFADMAKEAGLPKKLGYRPREVAEATGFSYSTVCRCLKDGHLESYLPKGMKRGRLSTPAMVDEWMKGGSDDA